ncbi:phosphatidate phosphatase LPIN1 isoform X1 [Parasteatoda tepidariorum]|uniref:phosphatidate phosphatase LPIN1 isoform X1 n=1 Tax=Parasteatoda tepidariorum TaxID=114398 RepID=UPI001C71D921|nr:phosphatidate phosphatase LPIN3 isoform X1 [Parasteatoda tepidariorum]XP_042908468.1 phosphatidate phosphatase LPIN3 isoform X1 [Parasteatoda tepidariorum]
MIYIGKFINNFKDFYNDINSATLTGAIDVIIVKQPDNTYVCSPFHVRFGKIGVLRSREKIVDIEVNGLPVDLHMKLGESGEAFFVEPCNDVEVLPSYLATSPLPEVPNIEAEIRKMKLEAAEKDNTKESDLMLESVVCSPNANCDNNSSGNLSKQNIIFPPHLKKQIDNVPIEVTNSVHTDSSDEYKTKRKRRKKVGTKKRSKVKEHPKPLVGVKQNEKEAEQTEVEEIFQMDEDYGEVEEGKYVQISNMSRSISLPVSSTVDDLFKAEWNRRKLSTTFTGEFHPFSDGDVTPQSSPLCSRPPSPKSDTEYENQKLESETPIDAPSWGWGQLPNVPRRLSDPSIQSNVDVSDVKVDENTTDVDKRSMLGGMLNFMRSTKKIRHMPEAEGIYLSELNAEELDPEVAALYFPKFKSNYGQQVTDEDAESGKGSSLPHSPHTVEGYPSQDSDSDDRLSLDQFSKEKCENISYPYSDIAMSLCGGLQDPEVDIPEERFLQSKVTFDDFTENPAVLQDPNLVIRIGGKFYNWSTAASMLTSIIMYQRPLPESAANKVINQYMPKKKKKSYSSWWSWRRTEESNLDIANNSAAMPLDANENSPMGPFEQTLCDIESSESASVAIDMTVKETLASVTEIVSEEVKIAENILQEVVIESHEVVVKTNEEKISESEESSLRSSPEISPETVDVQIDPPLDLPETVAQTLTGAKNIEDVKPFPEKYKKSLRLTSEQIKNLNLQNGPNEFTFSVTTAYQGTTKCTCHVFLWNYDDKIVISDIDGTITKSDVLGHILPIVGHSWAQLGVAKLFSKIHSNGYKFLYLSARAIGQARITRDYLRRVRQGEICLPDGPLLLSPTSLISALHREVIERKPEEFKISCLKDIQSLYPTYMGNPFYAGFGNKINDNWAYRAVGIPLTRSFTINHRGELKLELIQTFQSSYTRLSDDVDHVFPPLKPSTRVNGHPTPIFSSPEEYSYFTYWREPVRILDDDDDLTV